MTLNLRREFNNVMLGIAKVRAIEEAFKSAGLALASTEMGVKAGTLGEDDIERVNRWLTAAQ